MKSEKSAAAPSAIGVEVLASKLAVHRKHVMPFKINPDPSLPGSKPPIVPDPDPAPGSQSVPPLDVAIAINLADVCEINPLINMANIVLELVTFWHDPRLINSSQGDIDWGTHWHPKPLIQNGYGVTLQEGGFDCVLVDAKTGMCKSTCAMTGQVRVAMDLVHFPFDVHCIPIFFDFQIQGLPMEQATIRITDERENREPLTLDMEYSALQSWRLCGMGYSHKVKSYAQSFSTVGLHVFVAREPLSPLLRTGALMVMSTFFGFSAVRFNEVSEQLAMIITVFLTNGALMLSFAHIIPAMAYLTCMDKALCASFALTFVLGVVFVFFDAVEGEGPDTLMNTVIFMASIYTSYVLWTFFWSWAVWKSFVSATANVDEDVVLSQAFNRTTMKAALMACKRNFYMTKSVVETKVREMILKELAASGIDADSVKIC
jgi:hypothetical protein